MRISRQFARHMIVAASRYGCANALERLEQRRLLNAGDLDLSFGGGDGRRLYNQTVSTDLVALSTGKLLVAAPTGTSSGPNAGLELRRYNADGSPDARFGNGGTRTHALGAIARVDLIELSGGKLLAVGGLGASQRLVARFNADGSRDLTFGGGDGIVLGPAGSAPLSHAALRGDGKILAAAGDKVIRLNADGSVDRSFGNYGTATIALPPPVEDPPLGTLSIRTLTLTADNKILVGGAGTTTHYPAVARLLSNGSLDTTFNATGYWYYHDLPQNEVITGVAALSGNKMLCAARDEDGVFRVYQMLANGKPDAGFGGGDGEIVDAFGVVGSEPASLDGLIVQSDGKFVVTGSAVLRVARDFDNNAEQTSRDVSLLRFNADGTRDTSFNGGKTAAADFTDLSGDRSDEAPYVVTGTNLVRTSDGDYVVAGVSILSEYDISNRQTRFAMARFQGTAGGPSGDVPLVYDQTKFQYTLTGTSGADRLTIRSAGRPGNAVVLVEYNGNVQRLDPDTVVGCIINGGDGADTIVVDSEAIPRFIGATLNGGGGNDTITAGAGNDSIHGGTGNDQINAGTGSDVVYGDAGVDTYDFSDRGYGQNVTLNDKPDDGPRAIPSEKDNIHSDVENVIGGSGADLIVGTMWNDNLVGNGGNDTIWAGAGNDTVTGGAGADFLYGQEGNDTIYARDGVRDTVDGGPGTDAAQRDAGSPVSDLLTSIEQSL